MIIPMFFSLFPFFYRKFANHFRENVLLCSEIKTTSYWRKLEM